MAKYAQNTQVSTDSSKSEIDRTLRRYGATGFMYGWDQTSAVIAFEMNERRVKFVLPMPSPNERDFTHTPGRGSVRNEQTALKEWEKACRQRWRALALVIKAKLEAVESGITIFEEEFLAHIVLPNGMTVGATALPAVKEAYETGKMPMLLLK